MIAGHQTMKNLADLTEQIASSVLLTDPEDLPGLATLHERLKQVRGAAKAEAAGAQRERITAAAGAAEKLVEQLILREAKDAAAVMDSLCEGITELQKLISGALGGHAPDVSVEATPADGLTAPVAGEPSAAPSMAPTSAVGLADRADAGTQAVELAEAPIKDEDRPLVVEFIAEARGHIEAAEAELLRLEGAPEDRDVLNAIFRSFHTIKGVAGFLNLRQIGALAHAAESLLDPARKGELTLGGPALDQIFASIDVLKRLLDELDRVCHIGGSIAPVEGLALLLERLRLAARGQLGGANAQIANSSPAHPEGKPIDVNAATGKPAASASSQGAGASADATVKVATDRLDKLINMVGELVVAQAMVQADMVGLSTGNQRLARNMGQLAKITRELQDLSMSMRMVPIQGVFQKMARLVRDLARKSGKEVDFAVVGGETELDRNLVEAISDPLVHMVRNAVDHGTEATEARIAAGKPRAGRIELKAYHQAGNVVVEITDDGRGLNKSRILKKALEAGIVREGQELSEQEVFRLIFHAGLSTAEKITDISGRGVGMDVVRRNVENLRGRIDITSAEGKGSTFTIRLPLTLAVIDGLIVRVGAERFILPILSIEQSIRPKADQLSTVQRRGEMCHVRGQLLPLVRLHGLFKVRPLNEDPTQGIVVIVQDNDRRCCLLVDELLGQQQVVIKSLGDATGSVPGVSGGAILGDGDVSLILDVPSLMDIAAA